LTESEEGRPAGTKVDLTGRRVLVTGASSGIGEATCRAVVACGGSVAMLARRKERLDALAEELGERAVGIPTDVTDLDALEANVAAGADTLGGLDAVIAVAGQNLQGSIHTGTPQRWRALLDVNLVGPLATVRYALGAFPSAGRRDVVLIGSSACLTPMPGLGIYSASKRGLRAAFDSMRLELAHLGINVSHVVPGMFLTEGLIEKVPVDGERPETDAAVFAAGSTPAEVTALVDTIVFLLGLPDGVCINEVTVRPTGQLRT
jgi:NADP-dependent 3-hydroxy acid dehydrogenase YdfG